MNKYSGSDRPEGKGRVATLSKLSTMTTNPFFPLAFNSKLARSNSSLLIDCKIFSVRGSR